MIVIRHWQRSQYVLNLQLQSGLIAHLTCLSPCKQLFSLGLHMSCKQKYGQRRMVTTFVFSVLFHQRGGLSNKSNFKGSFLLTNFVRYAT